MESFIGQITLFAGNFAPQGWALCDGRLLPINQYQALFSILGTMYGGNGTNNFALPDLRGRVPVGVGIGPGLTDRRQGDMGGVERIALTTSQLPIHSHSVNCDISAPPPQRSSNPKDNLPGMAASGTSYGPNVSAAMSNAMVGPSGGNQSHDNMQPYSCLNYIICLDGIYPSRP
jgi:microcystin-dependent protein